jgi:hypothetical protein
MRAFLFSDGYRQAITTNQAGTDLPKSDNGPWQFIRAVDNAEREGLTDRAVATLQSEGFLIRARTKPAERRAARRSHA